MAVLVGERASQHESFLFVSGEAHIITDSGVDPLVGAVVRVGG